ncbi:nitrogenase component 1 [Lebetimonas sp. JH292]|uniref:nitrogenase component 1 n=1 Tax=Lebetimonas sp. JH292 TaxID=990068 RepID=UPI000467E041|nr:nitrogenase component 1 [Lebetimonas sp. JH292]
MKKYSPEAIFVYQTCVTALIGDNIDSVCKTKSEKFNIPIVPVHAPGFVGSKNLGSRLAGEDVLEYLIGTKDDIKIIVIILLVICGKLPLCWRAKLNVINCSKSLITLCRKMKEKYDIPWISASFYGKSESFGRF